MNSQHVNEQIWYIKSKNSDCTWSGSSISIEAGHLKIFDRAGRCTAAFAPGGWLFILEDEIAPPAEDLDPAGQALQ